MMVFEERGKQEHPEKNLLEQRREPTKFQATYGVDTGFDPGLHWWEESAGPNLALPFTDNYKLNLGNSFRIIDDNH